MGTYCDSFARRPMSLPWACVGLLFVVVFGSWRPEGVLAGAYWNPPERKPVSSRRTCVETPSVVRSVGEWLEAASG
jgi:hypothetical protein